MKILLVISSLGIGGEQRAASNLTNYFIENGNEVTILSFSEGSNGKHMTFNNNIRIIIRDKKRGNLYKLKCIRDMFDNYDIVIGFAVIPSILCSIARIGKKNPVIVCERNDPKEYPLLWKVVRSFAYLFSTAAVFQTNDASNYFSKVYFRKRTIIPNAVYANITQYRVPLSKRKKTIINTSRLTKVKNQELLIRAFEKLKNKYPDFIVEIYGDGENKGYLGDVVAELGLENRVYIKNAVSNIYEIVANASIFVLTSFHEGFPNSLAEAMCLGVACISVDCRIGGPKDMIISNHNGLLIENGDEKQLIDALDTLLSDEETRNNMALNAMGLANDLRIETIGKRWINFFEEVLKL